MIKIKTSNNIYFKFIELEKKYKFFEWKEENIYFYKLIRFELYNDILYKNLLIGKAHDKVKNFKRFLTILNFFLKDICYLKKKKVDVVIFDNNRFFYNDLKFESLYTFDLIRKLEKEKVNFEVEYPIDVENFYKYKWHSKIKIKILILIIYFKIKIYFMKECDLPEKIVKISKIFSKNFDIKLIDNKKIFLEIKKFQIKYNFYKKYFYKKEIKKIYLVCSYGKEALIAAAQDLDIEVIELQHGVMAKYHVGYNFPDVKIPYFPDKLLLWGEYWKDNVNLPKNVKIELYGYPYLKRQYEKYQNIEKNLNQVIFISQGTIGKKLSEKAIEFAKENPDLKVVYRLHPGEFLRWKKEYKDLYENRNLKNLEISSNNEKNLYEYLFESEYLIGVYSTVIYEALNLGIKIGVINLFGVEYVEQLIKEGYIELFQVDEKINIEKIKNLKIIKDKFFK